MPVVDPETYLRCCAEDALAPNADTHVDGLSELAVRADTLRAVDALAGTVIDQVLAAYSAAAALRGLRGVYGDEYDRPPARPHRSPSRWVRVPGKIVLPAGTLQVRNLVLTDGRVRLSGTLRLAPPPSVGPSPAGPPVPSRRGARQTGGPQAVPQRMQQYLHQYAHQGPPSLTLTDDRGQRADAHFSGSGTANQAQGRWTADGPLAADTRHLLIDGVKVELVDLPAQRVPVEPVIDVGRVEHHLRQLLLRLASGHDGMSVHALDWALDTLVAIGAVGPYDGAVEQCRTMSEVLADGVLAARAPANVLARLDEPWRSALARRGVRSHRRGTATLAADVVVDGADVTVHCAEINDGQLRLDVEADRAGDRMDQMALPVTFRAVDDAGNHYVGRVDGWETTDEYRNTATVCLWPPLDESAGEVLVVLAGDTEQATIRIELPGTTP